jgi:hypothetical protein
MVHRGERSHVPSSAALKTTNLAPTDGILQPVVAPEKFPIHYESRRTKNSQFSGRVRLRRKRRLGILGTGQCEHARRTY